MARAHTTNLLFDNGDFFTAETDQRGVRIGMVGGTCFDIPKGHAYYDRIHDASSVVEVEGYFDELMDATL